MPNKGDPGRQLDILLVNASLRDCCCAPVNGFTPVLGMVYIATAAAGAGFNAGVIDTEAHGLGDDQTIEFVNQLEPRWSGSTSWPDLRSQRPSARTGTGTSL